MVELTRGAVWQAELTEERFARIRPTTRIIHHLREGNLIRVRILAAAQPLPEAEEVVPTLEDSYLWLLEGDGRDESPGLRTADSASDSGGHAGGELEGEDRSRGPGPRASDFASPGGDHATGEPGAQE